ncbi:hypothetical protein [Nonomuraea basaltis]|nr:hypothetical protein [Nonomuraea basaltis]
MTAYEYHRKVIACWRVGCIERDVADRADYVGRHHKPTQDARPAGQG